MKIACPIILVLLAGLPLCAAAANQMVASPDQTPPGLAKSDWQSIREAYEAGRHAFTPAEGGGFVARNAGQQMRTAVDARGFTATAPGADWQWGLELTGFGWTGREVPPQGAPHGAAGGQKFTRTWSSGLEEWYVNDRRGLEHGFTVSERPDGAPGGSLSFLLAVRGEWQAEVEPGGQAVRFVRPEGGAALTYSGLKVWDADGEILPSRMTRASVGIRIEVEEAGARYPLTVDPVVQQAYLKPAAVGATQAGDNFGYSVAVSGDTVVVGAYGEDSSTAGVNGTPNEGAPDSGAAYVFVRSGGTWVQQAYLKASNPGASDWFGLSVAVSGDMVVVGAFFESSSSTGINSTPNDSSFGAGAAYVFVRSGTTWSQQAYLKPGAIGTTQDGDAFGGSVAVSGDMVVVGAQNESSNTMGVNTVPNESAASAGAAYVFTRSGTTWGQEAYLKPALVGTTQAGDLFGISVAAAGDTVVVGAHSEDSNTTGFNSSPNESAVQSGAAYVFTRSGTTWSQQAYLKPANPGPSDFFGTSVGVVGDTVVVGAPREDSGTTGVNSTPNEGAPDSGAAYVFDRSGTNWAQQAYLKSGNTGGGDFFGTAVSVSGEALVVGAQSEDSSTTGLNTTPNEGALTSGAAYLFMRNGTTWTQQTYLKAASSGAGDQFGISVALSGDTIVVGSPGEDSSNTGVNSAPNESASSAGAACTFVLPNPRLEYPAGTPLADAATQDLGSIASGAGGTPQTFTLRNFGTIDLTGLTLAMAGAHASDFALSAPAATTVPAGGTVTFTVTFTPGAPDFRTGLLTVSVGGEPVPRTTLRLTGFGLGAGLLNAVQQAYAKPEAIGTTQGADDFGWRVAVSGNTVVVGAYGEDSATAGVSGTPNESAAQAGAAYIFVRSGGGWTQQAYLKASNPQTNDFFGYSVAVSGDTVVVGALYEDSGTTGVNSTPNEAVSSAGAAYVFVRSGTTWTQQAYLKASNPGENDFFGNAVAVSGDTIVVAALAEDSSTTGVNSTPNESAAEAGAAYVFARNGATWTQQAYLKASNSGTSDYFGVSVGLSGDTVVVGASYEDSGTTGVNSTPNETANNAGAAYVFGRSGTAWTQQAYLKPAAVGTTQATDEFGVSVAVAGDTVVVGAQGEDSNTMGINSTPNEGATDAGAAYVFVRNGMTWSQQAYLKSSNPGPTDIFGNSVAVSGDTLVVGAVSEDSNTTGINSPPNESATDAGAAYAFVRNGLTWSQQGYFKANNTGAGDRFGLSVAVSGTTLVVGAHQEDSNSLGINSAPDESATNAGAAYFFANGAPVLVVEQPAGTALTDNASTVDFRGALAGGSTALAFTVRNTGSLNLTGLGITFDGAHPGDYAVTAAPTPPVAPGGSTAFVVTFTPGGLGQRNAVLHLANNDTSQHPFDIALTGIGVAPGDADGDGLTNLAEINTHGSNPNLADTDGDGIGDSSEVALATLGFNPLTDSSALRTLLQNNASAVGLYTADQVQALHVGPLLSRGANNSFKLTLGLKKSNNLTTFTPFPFVPAQTSVNVAGELEFLFTVPDNAAFFRVDVR